MNQHLNALLGEIRHCRICRDRPFQVSLPHEPRPVLQVSERARFLIVGQAPGTRAHASGRPFTDPSGDRLRRWLGIGADVFYDPARVAIASMGFCFPGQTATGADLPPRPECAPAWRSRLMAELPNIKLVVALGLHAQRWHMGLAVCPTLTETMRNWRAGLDLSPAVVPMPHPSWRNNAWLKANPWFAEKVLPEVRMRVSAVIG